MKQSIDNLAPDDVVKSCRYLERGSCFAVDGIRCCVHGTIQSPIIVTAEELRSGSVTHELVIQRKKLLFSAINGFTQAPTGSCKECAHLKDELYKNVSFDRIGGERLPGGLNIQHYTQCNQRCTYCWYTQTDNFVKPQYNIIDYLDLFQKEGKLLGNNWIDFSGGEPTTLKDFDEILNYLIKHDLGTVVVYSNAVKFSEVIYSALKRNKIILTTSLDTGVSSTYEKLRGNNTFARAITNLIRYRNSGTSHLWIKYVISDVNQTDDDLWSFVMAVLALRPNNIMICPDFPYGDRTIPDNTVRFAAKLWHTVQTTTGLTPIDYSSAFQNNQWKKYRADLADYIRQLAEERPSARGVILQKLEENSTSSAVANALVH